MNIYEELKKLEDLRDRGIISGEVFEKEKARLLSNPPQTDLMGMEENTFLMLMHLSQFAGMLVPLLGFILPIVLWQSNAQKNTLVNMHGKNIANFMISFCIYFIISTVLIFVIIGIPLLIALGILQTVLIIIAAVKANNGEYWDYPLAIKFFS